MEEDIAVAEPHHRHAGRERERELHARHRQILWRPVHDADIRPARLVLVERFVDRRPDTMHARILPRAVDCSELLASHLPTGPQYRSRTGRSPGFSARRMRYRHRMRRAEIGQLYHHLNTIKPPERR